MSSIPPNSRPGFRSDINGLRAWAVLVVILYHFGIPGFEGGFLGVDVFFVISGFLMTSIIVVGLTTGRFSLWKFYLARARRIVPALAVLCDPDDSRLVRSTVYRIPHARNTFDFEPHLSVEH